MQVCLNGKETTINESCVALADSLAEPPWKDRKLLVELNGAVVRKEDYDVIQLSDGDRIELVHFVGGGRSYAGLIPYWRQGFVQPSLYRYWQV